MRLRASLLALLASSVATVTLGAATGSQAAGGACGTATQTTVVGAYEAMARTIYQGERAGQEVSQDTGHVLASRALAAALAAGNSTAVLAATHALVYHRHWHIVRLRVLSRSGAVLADVGGPYVLAPVPGQISYRGKTVGAFLMSVQDDAGYAKLVQRFGGLPIEIYAAGKPVEGQQFPPSGAPALLPADGSPLSIGGVQYVAATYALKGFPNTVDRVLLAVPRVTAALEASSCLQVAAATYKVIAIHLAHHVPLPSNAGVFVGVDRAFDPAARIFVVSRSRLLASTDRTSAAPVLPLAGAATYLGQQWLVESFAPVSGVRVYLLYPAGQPVGATGPSGAS